MQPKGLSTQPLNGARGIRGAWDAEKGSKKGAALRRAAQEWEGVECEARKFGGPPRQAGPSFSALRRQKSPPPAQSLAQFNSGTLGT